MSLILTEYCNKEKLYAAIDSLRATLNITYDDYPINLVDTIRARPIDTKGPCLGIKYLKESPKKIGGFMTPTSFGAMIFINSALPKCSQDHVCGHELVHVHCHNLFSDYYDGTTVHQAAWREWQANEGSSELILPYKLVLPDVKMISEKILHMRNFIACSLLESLVAQHLAVKYNTTQLIAKYRLESLCYELQQFIIEDIAIDDIRILSKNKREKEGIFINANTVFNKLMDQRIPEYSIFRSSGMFKSSTEQKILTKVLYTDIQKVNNRE